MKLILRGTEEKPNIVEMEPRSLDNYNRSLNDLEDDVEDEEDEFVRKNRDEVLSKLNVHTSWKDLVGDYVAVRDAGLHK